MNLLFFLQMILLYKYSQATDKDIFMAFDLTLSVSQCKVPLTIYQGTIRPGLKKNC